MPVFEDFRPQSFPREVGILYAALKGEIKDTRLLGWVRDRCREPHVLSGVTIELQKKGVPVESHWLNRIISECILETNLPVDRATHRVKAG